MNITSFHIAQFNIGKLKQPLDHPNNKDFVDNLERINLLGENTEGFIWRLKDDEGYSATGVNIYEDSRMIVNLTVWDSIDSLYNFTYRDAHLDIFRKRHKWFEKMNKHTLVLWWIPKGKKPNPAVGKKRLNHLNKHGPSQYAFTFKNRFNPVSGDKK